MFFLDQKMLSLGRVCIDKVKQIDKGEYTTRFSHRYLNYKKQNYIMEFQINFIIYYVQNVLKIKRNFLYSMN